jgi:2-keto-4-pentenoate hydratase/2-oxohepta-3-ene-1,7-dioic acid hydratase in catechol pathway
MKLARLSSEDGPRLAIVIDDGIVDLGNQSSLPDNPVVFLSLPGAELNAVQEMAQSADRIPIGDAPLLAPIPRPSKFLAIGLNYADHVAESGIQTPTFPIVFAKMPSTVVPPFADVWKPRVSAALDYEGELGVVIGRQCRYVTRERARDVIAGYTIIDDVSVRDWQTRTPQWTLGKSFDTHGPTGPWLVTGDEIDPHNMPIRTLVNGDLRQESNTRELIHDCFTLVEYLSQVCTLEPGDLIATGTPGGVGAAMTPPRFLAPGDVVRVEIDGIGAIENTVVDEPVDLAMQ